MLIFWADYKARKRRLRGQFSNPSTVSKKRINRRLTISLILLILPIWMAETRCQDFAAINGRVFDSVTHEPVAGVLVTALPDGKTTFSGTDGAFALTRLGPGMLSLKLESAFHTAELYGPMLMREGDSREVSIVMSPLVVDAPMQEVTADRISGAGITSYPVSDEDRAIAANVGDFLVRNGYCLESDGRTKYASLRGFSPQSVLVLVDGVPINPDGAAADLATISTESVERIEVYHAGAASRFGANALGGAINIVSRNSRSLEQAADVSLSQGSHALREGRASLSLPDLGGFELTSDYEYRKQENDFRFSHPYKGELARQNNSSRMYSGYFSVRSKEWRSVTAAIRISNNHSGLPGAIFQESPAASARRQNTHYTLSYGTDRLNLSASFRELRQNYQDRASYLVYDKDYLQVARVIHGEYRREVWRNISSNLGADLQSESFFNDDNIAPERALPYVGRKTGAAYVGLQNTERFGISNIAGEARVRVDRVDGGSHTSPFFSLGYDLQLPVTIGAEASYGESFRLPPIDALFWRGDVFTEANPNLKPERAISREAKVSASYSRVLELHVDHTWFESDIDNLISWRRQFDGKYKPINVDRSRFSGREVAVNVRTRDHRFEVAYKKQYLNAVNLSQSDGYYGMTVPFKPETTERFTARLDMSFAKIDYAYSFTGERQIREANTKQLPGFALHDVVIEIPIPIWSSKHAFRAAVYNISDTHYELLERMPMPGRNYSLTLELQIF